MNENPCGAYKAISPFGKRKGFGTFDTFFDIEKYKTIDEAEKANDFVVVNFVEDENHIIYFEAYNINSPDNKKYFKLQIQHFPFGIDVFDDKSASDLAKSLF